MNILVCSKISVPGQNRTIPDWNCLEGHTVVVTEKSELSQQAPDAIISMGVGVMEATFRAIEKWPDVPLFCYNWDCYEWVWTNPRPGEYDYNRYGNLLKRATEIWVPSLCTGLRTRQWWNLGNWKVILPSCPWWDYDNITDKGYVLCTLRKIPDPYWDRFERACQELDIPYRMTQHNRSYEEYQETVAHCRFLVSHLYEASTGGLSLLEGYYLGKPCLISDSCWNGATEYFEHRATYFHSSDYNDLKTKLLRMYDAPLKIDRDESSRWVKEHFSDKEMLDSILERIEQCLKST